MATSPEAPLHDQRKVCHHAKDVYWKCLDDNNNSDQRCVLKRQEYEKCCPKKWIEYFDKRRQFNEFRAAQDKTGYIRKMQS